MGDIALTDFRQLANNWENGDITTDSEVRLTYYTEGNCLM